MEKIVLIDGHSILNRAFFALPHLSNSAGLHTNAILGFLNILFKTLEEEKPEYLAVAFDVHAPTFRHELYEEYKATRKPMAKELRQQVPVMKEVLAAMGVATVEKDGLEADDVLGTIAKRCEKNGLEVSLVSGDRDMLQLADEQIKIRIPKTRRTGTETEDYYAKDVKERYQVTPEELIEVKALMGDSSDNVPGVPGIGEKTATNLIAAYGSLENLYAHVDEVKNKRAQAALKNNYDLAQLSKKLVTIETNADIDFSLEQAKLGNLYTKEAYEKFQELEFKRLLSRFEKASGKAGAAIEVGASTIEPEKPRFGTISDFTQAGQIFEQAKAPLLKETIAFQLKGTPQGGLDFSSLALVLGPKECYTFPVEGFLSEQYLLDQLMEVIQKADCILTIDLKSQLKYFPKDAYSRLRKRESHIKDVHIAAYLLNPLKSDYGQDLSIAFEAWDSMAAQLRETGMEKLFHEVEMPLVFALYEMEEVGILVKPEELRGFSEELGTQIKTIETEIFGMAGEEFNLNSPKQLGPILFDKLGMPMGKKTKTGYSTAADVLEKLAPDYPIVSKILEYRQLAKLKSTYADGLSPYIKEDGRIHGNFNQTITATGRISSTEPNLQNIPIRMEIGRRIRKAFVPQEGFVFVDADYSQIELRVLAHMSGDERLIEAYQQAHDIHRTTASQVFFTPFGDVTDLQRRNAKAVNFGIVYGISSFGLSQGLSISPKEAREYIDKYFETYPKVKAFLDAQVRDAKEKGYVSTMFGRRRPVPEISSSNFVQRSFGERVAMNSPIQGTAADIIKIAMISVDRRLRGENMRSRLVLQVHDELLVEAAEEEVETVQEILRQEMESAAKLSVALEVGIGIGKNWYDAH